MTEIFIEGFDKYGPTGMLGTTNQTLAQLLIQGEWTAAATATPATIVAPLSGLGQALNWIEQENFPSGPALSKTFSTSYSRLIGGIRFAADLSAASNIIQLLNSSTACCTIQINTAGTISLRTGVNTGTVLGTSTTTITANSTHYLEWDITFGSSSSYNIYLDGASILSGTGNTGNGQTSANTLGLNQLVAGTESGNLTVDDLYLFSSAGSTNNAVLNTSPVVETQFPISDSSVQFTFGAAIIGQNYYITASQQAPGANTLFLRHYIPGANCTLNSIGCLPRASNGSANFQAVVYSTSGGAPHTLLSAGITVTGCTSGTALVSSLSSPQNLLGGTEYWIGFITDTSIVLQEADGTTAGELASNTFTSGAPATAPTMTTGEASWMLWGNVVGIGTNYSEVDLNPNVGSLSYVSADTSGTTDLYNFPTLSTAPLSIYTVAVKACVILAITGVRTVSLEMESNGHTSTGSNPGQTPLSSFTYLDSFFDTDPNTSVAWTAAGLNAATSGQTVAS